MNRPPKGDSEGERWPWPDCRDGAAVVIFGREAPVARLFAYLRHLEQVNDWVNVLLASRVERTLVAVLDEMGPEGGGQDAAD